MNITADANGGMEVEEIRLRKEDLSGVNAELTDLDLGELDLFASFAF